MPNIEVARYIIVKVYNIYHLHYTITDYYGHDFVFTQPFITINRDSKDTPVLLGRPVLKNY